MTRPAIGVHNVANRKLGLAGRTPGRAPLMLSWTRGVVPPSPVATDHLTGWTHALLGNNIYGNCGPVSVANHRELTTALLTSSEDDTTLDEVLDLYRRSSSPPFNPVTGENDNGVYMDALAAAVNFGGLGGSPTLACASLADTSDESIAAAVHVFGGVLIAVTLQLAQQGQTDAGTWDYRRTPVWGGHAVLLGSYDKGTGLYDVVTWGERVRTTRRFRQEQLDEVWLPIWPELLSSGKFFDSGVDVSRFAADFLSLTGKEFPVKPPTSERITIDAASKTFSFPPGWRQV